MRSNRGRFVLSRSCCLWNVSWWISNWRYELLAPVETRYCFKSVMYFFVFNVSNGCCFNKKMERENYCLDLVRFLKTSSNVKKVFLYFLFRNCKMKLTRESQSSRVDTGKDLFFAKQPMTGRVTIYLLWPTTVGDATHIKAMLLVYNDTQHKWHSS